MPPVITPSPQASGQERNRAVYRDFWASRFRRKWTYSTQSKVRRFRSFLRREGLLRQRDLAIFDQGFGLGLMLFCFDRTAFIAGTELSAEAVAGAAQAARDQGFTQADLRAGEVGAPWPPEWLERFDLVVSSHVLEHLEDPESALRDLVRLIRPGGLACLLVPINEQTGEDLNHLQYFGEESIQALVRRTSLEIVRCQSFDRLYQLLKPLAKSRQRRDTPALRLLSKLVNGFLAPLPGPLLRGFDHLLALGPFPCTQCIVLARKPSATQPANT